MKLFEVSGVFKKGKTKQHPFTLKVNAEKEEIAEERTYLFLGSKQKCPRRWITIKTIKEAQENSEEFSSVIKNGG
jgi:ribosomal protein L20A (L18A)